MAEGWEAWNPGVRYCGFGGGRFNVAGPIEAVPG